MPERHLLALLRAESAEETTTILRALSIQEEAALFKAAQNHGLTPALYDHLAAWPSIDPSSLWERLKADYWQTAAYNTLLYHELGRVLAALLARGIRVLVLKGAALAETVYDNVALRPMGDADLLLPKAALPQALAILQEMGYRRDVQEPHAGFGPDYENEIALMQPTSDMPLELHWHLIDSPFHVQEISEEAIWAEAVPVRIAGWPVESLRPETMIAYLSAHWVLHHHSRRLLWLYDLDRLIRRYQAVLSWDKVIALAQVWRFALPLQGTLRLCHEYFGTALPAEVWEKLQAMPISQQEARVFALLTSPRRDVISRFWADLSMIRGTRRKLRYFWYNLFPSRDYMAQRYVIPAGRAVWPYYLFRLAKGIVQAMQRMLAGFVS